MISSEMFLHPGRQTFGANSSWWYSEDRSNALKWVAPFKSAMRSSIVGIRCFSLLIALFASRMSTQVLTSPDFLGTTTIGLIQVVGSSTVPMMSNKPLDLLLYMEWNSPMELLSGCHTKVNMPLHLFVW